MLRLHRPTDPLQKAQIFGWDNPLVQNAIGATIQKEVGTSTTAGPVIRQDLAVEVYEVFVKLFPLIDMLPKHEANGLVDAFERQLNYTTRTEDTPLTIGETGSVSDDANQYVQDTCNIAVFASRRGASLKASFAARATGSIDVAGREVAGGLLKIAHDFQTEAFRAQNVTATGAGAATNLGIYDANGFKGLRYQTEFMSPSSNVVQIDVSAFVAANQAVTNALSQVVNTIIDLGGSPDICLGSAKAREYLRQEAYAKTTFFGDQKVEVIPNVFVPGFTVGNGETLPYMNIPGFSVNGVNNAGYSINADGHVYIDMYVADSSMLSIPWLGSPSPTLIEVPLASDGTLRKLTIPYWMASLEVAVPMFLGKVRLKLS